MFMKDHDKMEIESNSIVSISMKSYTGNQLRMRFNGVEQDFMNSIRREVHRNVCTLAIDEVIIRKNTSCIHDQFLAQILGGIIINSRDIDLNHLSFPSECGCNQRDEIKYKSNNSIPFHCNQCCIILNLSVINNNLDKQIRIVTDRDLIAANEMDDKILYKSNRYAEIVQLGYNQEIDISVFVRKGNGKLHRKWNPACKITSFPITKIKIDENINKLNIDDKRKIINSCPAKIFTINENGNINHVDIEDSIRCTHCESCLSTVHNILIEYDKANKDKDNKFKDNKSKDNKSKDNKSKDKINMMNKKLIKCDEIDNQHMLEIESTESLDAIDILKFALQSLLISLNEIEIDIE